MPKNPTISKTKLPSFEDVSDSSNYYQPKQSVAIQNPMKEKHAENRNQNVNQVKLPSFDDVSDTSNYVS